MAAKATTKGAAKKAASSAGKAPARKTPPAKSTAPAGKPAAGKAPAGKPAAGKAPAGKPAAGKAPAGKPAAGKAPAGTAPAGKPSSGKPTAPAKSGRGAVEPSPPAPPSRTGAKGPSAPSKPGARVPAPSPVPSRPAMPPPRPSKRGEGITLVPARSSQPGLRPPPPPAKPSGRGQQGAARGNTLTLVRRATERPTPASQAPLPIPVRKLEAAPTIEQRFARIEERLAKLPAELQSAYFAMLDKSWIYHDSALEGVVYTLEELNAGLAKEPVVTDSSLQPAADEIRRHKEAIEYVRDAGQKKRVPITVDVIKKIYLILHPSEGDLKTVKYRRDIPQHRLYFHEYAAPDKITYKVRQVSDWLNDPETKKTRNALRIAARAHYDLIRVFPFQTDSGKVARLFMNLLLYKAGYPPAIIHSTERQRYYDALKGSPNTVQQMVQEAVENGLASVEKMLEEHEQKTRAH